jgi:DNA-binding response OmpR family regulator
MSEATEQGVVIVFGRADDALAARIEQVGAVETVVVDELEALASAVDRQLPAVVVVDLRVAIEPWSAIVREINPGTRAEVDRAAVIVAADTDEWHRAIDALAAGAVDCLRLPVDDAELRARITSAMVGRHARLAERHTLGEAIHGDSLQVLAALTMRLQLVQRRAQHAGMTLDASA